MPTVKNEKGQFVKAPVVDERDAEIEQLKAQLAQHEQTQVPYETESEKVDPAREESQMPPLRLQSRYRGHTIQVEATRRVFHVGGGVTPVPGVPVRFAGPQRIFDSSAAQKELGWSDELRDRVERMLVTKPEFMVDYFPAPMSPIPEHLNAIAIRKPPERQQFCQSFSYDEHGDFVQCGKPAMGGQKYCKEHDPDKTRIITGGGTTLG